MAVKRLSGSLNVLEASEERIKNVFATGLDVHMALSGGKDSIVKIGRASCRERV